MLLLCAGSKQNGEQVERGARIRDNRDHANSKDKARHETAVTEDSTQVPLMLSLFSYLLSAALSCCSTAILITAGFSFATTCTCSSELNLPSFPLSPLLLRLHAKVSLTIVSNRPVGGA